MAETKSTVDTLAVPLSPYPGVADTALLKPDDLKPATDMAASGALIEPTIVERIDVDHPSVDNAPRAGQPVIANRIDFNDPSVPGHVQVARNLGLAEDYDAPPPADGKAGKSA